MSHHLVASDGRAFTATPALWESALFLAEKYGWKPAGTEPPPLPEDVIHSKSVRGFRIWERMLDRWDPERRALALGSLVLSDVAEVFGRARSRRRAPDRAALPRQAPAAIAMY